MTSTAIFVLVIYGMSSVTLAQAPAPAPYVSVYDDLNALPDWTGPCLDGTQQSPVELLIPEGLTSLPEGAVEIDWSTSAIVNVSNPDHDSPQINFPAGSTTKLSFTVNSSYYLNTTWELLQVHWHHKSEHAFNGTHADLEVHLVHSDPSTGGDAVLAILLWNGNETDPALETALQYRPQSYTTVDGKRVWDTVPVPQPLDLQALFSPYVYGPFAYYVGSLTTPPCTQNVPWVVYTSYFELSASQLAEYSAYVQENNGPAGNELNERPDQPLNGREVTYIGEAASSSA